MYIMPAGIPPHKLVEGEIRPSLRMEMARAAFKDLDRRIVVSDYEITKEGASYTSETLKHLTAAHPNGELYLFCGTDMFLTLPTWHEPEYIFAAASIVCIYRDSRRCEVTAAAEQYRSEYSAKVSVITEPPTEISSSEVRAAIRRGDDVRPYVPPTVAQIIERESLYR
jgi:nicotinate-nucleotide adenylyltransferase